MSWCRQLKFVFQFQKSSEVKNTVKQKGGRVMRNGRRCGWKGRQCLSSGLREKGESILGEGGIERLTCFLSPYQCLFSAQAREWIGKEERSSEEKRRQLETKTIASRKTNMVVAQFPLKIQVHNLSIQSTIVRSEFSPEPEHVRELGLKFQCFRISGILIVFVVNAFHGNRFCSANIGLQNWESPRWHQTSICNR